MPTGEQSKRLVTGGYDGGQMVVQLLDLAAEMVGHPATMALCEFLHWFRVKKQGLLPRYRLFFQFRSEAPKTIIYAWLNDERTLRKAGDKNDVYAVFYSDVERRENAKLFC